MTVCKDIRYARCNKYCQFCGKEILSWIHDPIPEDATLETVLWGEVLRLDSTHPGIPPTDYSICYKCEHKFKKYLDSKLLRGSYE